MSESEKHSLSTEPFVPAFQVEAQDKSHPHPSKEDPHATATMPASEAKIPTENMHQTIPVTIQKENYQQEALNNAAQVKVDTSSTTNTEPMKTIQPLEQVYEREKRHILERKYKESILGKAKSKLSDITARFDPIRRKEEWKSGELHTQKDSGPLLTRHPEIGRDMKEITIREELGKDVDHSLSEDENTRQETETKE